MMEELEQYLIESDKISQIIPKIYVLDYEIGEDNW